MKVARTIFLSLSLALGSFLTLGCSDTGAGEVLDEYDHPSDAISRSHSANVREMVSILPAEARAVVAIDFGTLFSSNSSGPLAALLYGSGLDETLGRPLRLIAQLSLGIDIQATMTSALLVQATDPRDGSALLSKIRFDNLSDIPGLVTLVDAPAYREHAIYIDPSSGLGVTLLEGRLLVIGRENTLHAVIDVHAGDSAGAESGALSAYLADLYKEHPITVVVGMPALYKQVTPGVNLKSSVAFSVWLEMSDRDVSGEAIFYLNQASQFATTYNDATKTYNQPPLTTIAKANGKENGLVVPIDHFALAKNPSETIASRHAAKMLFLLMEAKDNISGIATGAVQPWKNFTVNDSPPSIFINFEIREAQVKAFSDAVLPAGFEMMKLRILETDTPAYYLVLNAYTATGIAAGVRQEWSVFVRDPVSGKPRFLVIEAMSKNPSMDPVNMFTKGQPVSHGIQNGQLVTEAYKKVFLGKKHYFTSKINWPQANPIFARSAREFVSANDSIFWGNGVADRGLYSGNTYNREVVLVPPGQYSIVNDTSWAGYINPQPKSVYAYQNGLDIIVAMWANLDAPYLDVTEARRQKLSRTRNNLTTGLMNADVSNAFKGSGHAILGFEHDNLTPSAYFNYRLDESKIAQFESNLALPSGFHLRKTKILESEGEKAFYLTLVISTPRNAMEGTRAQWLVYVDDGTAHEHVMVLELMTEDVALEPVALLNLPSVVIQEMVGRTLNTTLSSPLSTFSASLSLDAGVEVLHSRDWVEAGEIVCYLNGICDKVYIDGGTLTEPLLSLPPVSVQMSVSTPWSDFIEPLPRSVLVRTKPQVFASKPWMNVNP